MSKPLIIIIIIFILIIAAAIIIYFTTDIFDGIINKESANENTNAANTNTQTNTSQTNTTVQNSNKVGVSDVLASDTTDLKTYESSAGFSFQYPATYIEYDFNQLLGFHTPEDNTDTVSFAMPRPCYDKVVALFDVNSNLDIEPDITEVEYFGDQCVLLDITKESKSFTEELDSWLDSNTNTSEQGTDYSFVGMEGKMTTSVEEQDGVNNYRVILTGTLGDYVFTIDHSGHGISEEEIIATVKGIAQTMDIDESFLTETDPYADQDEDGLANKFENLYGTDVNLADTDGDGYDDRAEANNCFNPVGEGKMTGEYFIDYCTAYIASSSFASTTEYDNRNALCTAWMPIAQDFINDILADLVTYDGWYEDYPEICNTVDTLMGEEYCSTLDVYLGYMCPEKD